MMDDDKFVYFLRGKDGRGPIKIGCSATPIKRLRSVEIWSPVLLEILAHAPGHNRHEGALHDMFVEHRLHGEWFEPTPDLMAVIEHVRTTGTLPPLPVPTNWKERRAYNVTRKTKPRRGAWQTAAKARLTGRVRAAERHAFGYDFFDRPDDIAEILASYQGFGAPLPTDEQVEALTMYVDKLFALPRADRSHAAWEAWFERRKTGRAA